MGSTVRRLTRNTAFSLLSSATRLSANAVLFILVARFYGPEGFGQFTTAHTLSTIFILIADFGFDMLLTTELSQRLDKASFLVPRMIAIKLVLALGASLLMCTYGILMHLSPATRDLTLILSLYLFFSALLNFMFALFKAHEEMHHESVITLIVNLFLLAVLAMLGVAGASLAMVAGAFVLSRVLGLVFAIRKGRKFTRVLLPIVDLPWIRSIIKQVSVFGIFFVFGNMFFTLDTILLSIWRGDYDVGVYQAVFRIVAVTLILPEIAVTAILPSLSRFYGDEKEKWRQIGSTATKTLFFAGILLGLVLTTAALPIVTLIYGSRGFGQSVHLMKIFGGVVFVRYTVEVFALMLTTSRRQHVRMVLVVGATILNLALNSYAIPRYGVDGAATVSLVTNVAVGIAYILAASTEFRISWFSRQLLLPFFVILAGGATVVALPSVTVWTVLGPVAVVYLFTVYYFGYSDHEKGVIVRSVLGGGTP